MATRKRRKKTPKKSAKKRKASGLTKYRTAVKRATVAIDRQLRKAEARMNVLKRKKKAKVKKVTAAYRRKHK